METPSKPRRALRPISSNLPSSPINPQSELSKRPLDLFPGTTASPLSAKRTPQRRSNNLSSRLQPAAILADFSLGAVIHDDTENLPPVPTPRPALGSKLGMSMFEGSPDASRAFFSACASSPVGGISKRVRRNGESRLETRQRAEALRLRLGLASYKVKTGQTDLPLEQLQVRPCRSPFRHSFSFSTTPISSLRSTVPESTTQDQPTFPIEDPLCFTNITETPTPLKTTTRHSSLSCYLPSHPLFTSPSQESPIQRRSSGPRVPLLTTMPPPPTRTGNLSVRKNPSIVVPVRKG